MKAGTLEIEIIGSVARLQEDMRKMERLVSNSTGQIARSARAANDNLRAIGAGGTAGLQQFSREVANLKAQLDPAWAATQRYKDQMKLLQQALREGAITHKQFVGEVRTAVATYQNASKSFVNGANSQRTATNQLSIQFGDFLSQVASGGNPMVAFGQQLSQVQQVMALTSTTTKGFAGFMAGPWGAAISFAALALGPLIANLFETEKATNDLADSEKRLVDAQLDLLFARAELDKALGKNTDSYNIARQAAVDLAKAEVYAANVAILAAEARISAATAAQETNRTLSGFGVAAGAPGLSILGKALDWWQGNSATIKDAATTMNKTMGDLTEAQAKLARAEAALAEGPGSDKGSSKKTGLSEIEKQYKAAVEAADNYIKSLEDEIARIGLTEIEIRMMESARAKEAAVTEDQKNKIEELTAAREAGYSSQAREKAIEKDLEATAALTQYLRELEAELTLLGLVGPKRELAALALEETSFKAKAAKDGIEDVSAAWEEYLRVSTNVINGKSAFEREAQAAEILNDQLRDMISALEGLGGVGKGIGGLLGLFTGNTSAIGGSLGKLLNMPTGNVIDEVGADGRKTGKLIGETIGDKLSGFFDKNSPIIKALQGAGTGMMAANAFGMTSTGGQLGSAIGGALGEKLGEKFLSKGLESIAKGLGDFAGPLGSILGGLLGGALGGLLGTTPRGSATIGGVNGALGITGTRGNSQSRIAAASKNANAVIDGLESLAAELGATIDPSRGSVSIGIRKGNIRVDTSGMGKTKTKNGAIDFGEDAEAAAFFAMQDLIRDGVLVGLRAGTEKLLKEASDLESGVQKALAFEGVFRELKALNDPLGAAMDSLEREFDRLSDIFEEAGATAEEYAQLEELFLMKRQEAIDESNRKFIDDQRDRIDLEVDLLQLLGREQEALALARETELAGLKATLRPLQSMIFTLQDARAIIDQFGPLAEGLKAFKDELLGSRTSNTFGALQSQFRSTASLAANGDATALGKLQQVSSAYLDAARDNASSALEYQRAVGEVLASVDAGIFAADSQVEWAQMQIDAINAQSGIIEGLKEQLRVTQDQLVAQGEWQERMFRRWDGDGLRVRNDEDTPVFTQVVV